jgi:hypothetical protein
MAALERQRLHDPGIALAPGNSLYTMHGILGETLEVRPRQAAAFKYKDA